ncbi:hypothetical protein NC652_020075 [Populus alba x Populus x berolinensis]|uniref:Uncharacterized protein n=1 Tax=Populus alba x Populus x berolinensis TaxID=444605 RepID=A0AAD6MP18_9ROSI|nr:hypothetical protein NC652_020075 [Populus alba x Populus x berolinensis]KAJ6989128.1 hypothetical protein NC653_021878 [Populus alba x Populus x berolinensis]
MTSSSLLIDSSTLTLVVEIKVGSCRVCDNWGSDVCVRGGSTISGGGIEQVSEESSSVKDSSEVTRVSSSGVSSSDALSKGSLRKKDKALAAETREVTFGDNKAMNKEKRMTVFDCPEECFPLSID